MTTNNSKTTSETTLLLPAIVGAILAALAGCAGSHDEAATAAPAVIAAPLACDDGIKSAFKADADTSVLLVRAFRKGDG